MVGEVTNIVVESLPKFEGYVYPNEAIAHPLWGFLIVIYPYITGLVAGAFIMASLVRVFEVKALEPVYRLSMLTALAFLLSGPATRVSALAAMGSLLNRKALTAYLVYIVAGAIIIGLISQL
jgi:Ni/Fe-hydrogenase subunit HybB-like protein